MMTRCVLFAVKPLQAATLHGNCRAAIASGMKNVSMTGSRSEVLVRCAVRMLHALVAVPKQLSRMRT